MDEECLIADCFTNSGGNLRSRRGQKKLWMTISGCIAWLVFSIGIRDVLKAESILLLVLSCICIQNLVFRVEREYVTRILKTMDLFDSLVM